MNSTSHEEVKIRPALPEDSEACGHICYHAFSTISAAHNFPRDLPVPEVGVAILSMMFSHPSFYCVVAEINGRIVGSNCLDERAIIAGVGPITVDPTAQNRGVGRALMDAVLQRAHQRHAAGVRLVQAAFHNRSLSLYTKLGFDVREPLSCLQGRTDTREVAGCRVRRAELSDVDACNKLSTELQGFKRGGELTDGINAGTALVVERNGRITGYTSALAFFGYATAESNLDIQALLASADGFGGPGILLPTRNAALLRWCLANGLKVVQPMTLMSMGLYNNPTGAWLPSVSF